MTIELEKINGGKDIQAGRATEQPTVGSRPDDLADGDGRRFRDAMGGGARQSALNGAFARSLMATAKVDSNGGAGAADSVDGLASSLLAMHGVGAFVPAQQLMTVPVGNQTGAPFSIDDAIAKIVSRLLVSDAALRGGGEVHLRLRDTALSGADIRMQMDGGRLQIVFFTANVAQTALVEQNYGQLLAAIVNRTKVDDVEIAVWDGDEARVLRDGNMGRSKGGRGGRDGADGGDGERQLPSASGGRS
ncbi:MAG: hypothetical protein LBI39_04640 [Puniceicoccales bacterium]|jgi:hypothetical protein|nr:hypothetical protein [Puniceicoccales bacterium]